MEGILSYIKRHLRACVFCVFFVCGFLPLGNDASAQTAFTCDDTVYLSQQGQLYRIDQTTTPFTSVPIGSTAVFNYNAMGLNAENNFIYAMGRGADNGNLKRIDSQGNVTNIDNTLSGGIYTAGTFDGNGNFYIKAFNSNTTMYRVDVGESPPTYTLVALDTARRVNDMAFNPRDDLLYAHEQDTDTLLTINPSTGVTSTMALTGPFVPALGGSLTGSSWFDTQGRFYVLVNDTREIYRINIQTGATELVNSISQASTGDATSCVFTNDLVTSTKTADKSSASPGDFVTYTITLNNTSDFVLSTVDVTDNLPSGFSYVDGSATINDVQTDPDSTDPLTFNSVSIAANSTTTIRYTILISAGLQPGSYTNTVNAVDQNTGFSLTVQADVAIEVENDALFDLTTIIGKVFHDKNKNGVQDEGEIGIPGAKVVSATGEIITTDRYGRYHLAAVESGRNDRGTNFILKLDVDSLPEGSKLTTENPRVQRLTSGVMTKFNFGVSLPDDGKIKIQENEVLSSLPVVDTSKHDIIISKTEDNVYNMDVIPTGEPTTSIASSEIPPIHNEKFLASLAPAAGHTNEPYVSVSQDQFSYAPKLNVLLKKRIGLSNPSDRSKLFEDAKFYIYSNYHDFIENYEILIFDGEDDDLYNPLKTITAKDVNNFTPIKWNGILDNNNLVDANKSYKYILRVYDKDGSVDETSINYFNILPNMASSGKSKRDYSTKVPGFGIDRTESRAISLPLGKIVVYGQDLKPGDIVKINGTEVTVDENGSFVEEMIKSTGTHNVKVSVDDSSGKNKVTREQAIKIEEDQFFYVGMTDLTIGKNDIKGPIQSVTNDDHFDEKVFVDGRVVFYLKGKIKGKYLLTAHVDTHEEELKNLFNKLDEKDTSKVFRNLDPDRYYPVYGDGSTLINDVNSQGKIYVRLDWDKSQAIVGNFNTIMHDTELTRYNRSLYGAQLHLGSIEKTKYGDQKHNVTAFVSEAHSQQDHNEFLSTGGSLYYLRHKDVLEGSEKIAVEVRDQISGHPKARSALTPGIDYEIDYIQGRILLKRPLQILAESDLLISNSLLNGDPLHLIVDYEYDSNVNVKNVPMGVRAFKWLDDHFGVGVSNVREVRDNGNYTVAGVDAKVKPTKGFTSEFEYAKSEQTQIPGSFSIDGGLNFVTLETSGTKDDGKAFKIAHNFDIKEMSGGNLPLEINTAYRQKTKGFSSNGEDAEHDTRQIDTDATYEFSEDSKLKLQHTEYKETDDFSRRVATAQLSNKFSDKVSGIVEVSHRKIEEFENNIQPENPENDSLLSNQEDVVAAAKVDYALTDKTKLYAIQQATIITNDDAKTNNITTLGTNFVINDEVSAQLEGSYGTLGGGGKAGMQYNKDNGSNVYSYFQSSVDRVEGRTYGTTVGSHRNLNDKMSTYSENHFKNSSVEESTADVYGLKYHPDEKWEVDAKYEVAHVVKDRSQSFIGSDITRRFVPSVGVSYRERDFRAFSRIEGRFDKGTERINQYLSHNSLRWVRDKEMTYVGEFNYSLTRNRTNDTDSASFIEASIGAAYRPIYLDDLNTIWKYSYLEDMSPTSQVESTGDRERAHIFSIDSLYDLDENFSVGGKGAYRFEETRQPTSTSWLSSQTYFLATRLDYHVVEDWDVMVEPRYLNIKHGKNTKTGFLTGIYKHLGENAKIGTGYNFTDFSDDLTNLDYDAEGWFFNVIGKF